MRKVALFTALRVAVFMAGTAAAAARASRPGSLEGGS